MIEILHYCDADGRDVFAEWIDSLADARAIVRVTERVNRIAAGNFGDHKFVGEGVYEARIDYGPGYRLYYSTIGKRCVLLLCGGDKRRQGADIRRAISYLADYFRRSR